MKTLRHSTYGEVADCEDVNDLDDVEQHRIFHLENDSVFFKLFEPSGICCKFPSKLALCGEKASPCSVQFQNKNILQLGWGNIVGYSA